MSHNNFQPIFDYIDKSHEQLKEIILEEVDKKFIETNTVLANIATDIKDIKEELHINNYRKPD